VILSDTETGEVQFEFKGHEQEINALAFAENGAYILTGCEDGTSKLINIQGNIRKHASQVMTMGFSQAKLNLMAMGLKNGDVFIYQNEGKLQTKLQHPKGILSLQFAPKAHQILTAGNDKTARLWDTKNGQLIRTFKGHQGRIYAVNYNVEGTKILTASDDHTLKIWDTKNGQLLHTFDEKNDRVRTAQFFPKQNQLVSGSWQGNLKIRTLEGQEVFNQAIHTGKINAIAVSPDGTKIILMRKDKNYGV